MSNCAHLAATEDVSLQLFSLYLPHEACQSRRVLLRETRHRLNQFIHSECVSTIVTEKKHLATRDVHTLLCSGSSVRIFNPCIVCAVFGLSHKRQTRRLPSEKRVHGQKPREAKRAIWVVHGLEQRPQCHEKTPREERKIDIFGGHFTGGRFPQGGFKPSF